MKLFQNLKRITSLLKPYSGSWAVCGGIAACIYRDIPRFTGDIDIAVVDTLGKSSCDIATQILTDLDYKAMPGYVTDQKGALIPGQALVIGREENPSHFLGVDFLLPVLPWVNDAVYRAQSNLLDFGFEMLPTITIEDLCLAKIYAFQGSPTRVTDKEDVLSILSLSPLIDSDYFSEKAQSLGLNIPDDITDLLGFKVTSAL